MQFLSREVADILNFTAIVKVIWEWTTYDSYLVLWSLHQTFQGYS